MGPANDAGASTDCVSQSGPKEGEIMGSYNTKGRDSSCPPEKRLHPGKRDESRPYTNIKPTTLPRPGDPVPSAPAFHAWGNGARSV